MAWGHPLVMRWFSSCLILRHASAKVKSCPNMRREIWVLWRCLWQLRFVSIKLQMYPHCCMQEAKFSLFSVTSHPCSMNSDLQMSFVRLWQRALPHPEELSAIISPLTLFILQRAAQPKSTWDKMETFLTRLLKHELLFPIPFEDQIFMLLQPGLDWDPVGEWRTCALQCLRVRSLV